MLLPTGDTIFPNKGYLNKEYLNERCLNERYPYGGISMADTEYITSKEAAEILEISTKRVVGLCNDGRLNGAVRKGRVWKIPRESVLLYQHSGQLSGESDRLLSCAVGNTPYSLNNPAVNSTLN